ncbi:MAG: GAF domain-containing protein [Chloroflexi bacterium]|nr:GAF domain-containing protein [Chloroflexota bacterium]
MVDASCNYCRTLHKVALAINSTLKPDIVLYSTVHLVTESLEAKACSLLLLDPSRTHLEHAASYGLSEQYIDRSPLAADPILAEVLNGKSLSIHDVTKEPKIKYHEHKKDEGIASMLCVPVVLRDKDIGVIIVYTSHPRNFTKDEVAFVEAIASLCAVSLENAKIYESINKDRDTYHKEMLEWRATRWQARRVPYR